jgi:hypothetical protein
MPVDGHSDDSRSGDAADTPRANGTDVVAAANSTDRRAFVGTVVPTWITAIGGAVAALSAFVFGLVQLTDDGDDDPQGAGSLVVSVVTTSQISATTAATTTATTTTTIATATTPAAASDVSTAASRPPVSTTPVLSYRLVADDVIEFEAPTYWSIERSYNSASLVRTAPELREHTLVAATNMEVQDNAFWRESGVAVSVSSEFIEVFDVLDDDRRFDETAARKWLDEEFPWGIECDPNTVERHWNANGYQGLLREWSTCGTGGVTSGHLIDGILIDDGATHAANIQIRPGPFDTDEIVNHLLSTLSVDVDAMHQALDG